jgi:hypothetical protein
MLSLGAGNQRMVTREFEESGLLSTVQVYPPSEEVVSLLDRMGVPPDFDADKPLRYAHRQVGKMDAYFVSNGASQAVEAACRFRVTGKRPELWHPETGRIRPLPSHSFTDDGRTVVPLRFELRESYFVVFRESRADGRSRNAGRPNFLKTEPLAEITGPWQVTFDPKWGGPEAPLTFEKLDDWSKRPEPGIRHYSGTAVYRTTFEMPPTSGGRGTRGLSRFSRSENGTVPFRNAGVFLDLGAVHEFAQIRLNGENLGIAWKRPFRVEVTRAMKAGANELEIEVTNLWPNRMIGDESLPADDNRNPSGTYKQWPRWLLDGESSPTGRYTFATWRHYDKDSPLLPSGLLGPVRLQGNVMHQR